MSDTKKIIPAEKKSKKNSVLVVICGGSGSGKTTVAKLITDKLRPDFSSCIISLDNFYIPSYRIKTDNFDIPEALDWDLVNKTLTPLLDGHAVKCPIYSFVKRDYVEFKPIKPCDIVIVEGILSLNDQRLREMADIKIYVEVPDDERLIRRLLRDIAERDTDTKKTIEMWRSTVIEAHHKYVEPCRYYSDLILFWGGLKPNEVAIEASAGAIEFKFLEKNKKAK